MERQIYGVFRSRRNRKTNWTPIAVANYVLMDTGEQRIVNLRKAALYVECCQMRLYFKPELNVLKTFDP